MRISPKPAKCESGFGKCESHLLQDDEHFLLNKCTTHSEFIRCKNIKDKNEIIIIEIFS